jgi:hypothetical protein
LATPSGGYFIGDKRVPSVTTILSFGLAGFSKDALLKWAWTEGVEGRDFRETRDKAATAGTIAHSMIEAFLNGDEHDCTDYPPEQVAEATQAFGAFQDWHREHAIEIVEQEVQLVSAQHKFGGCFDALGSVNGVPTLLDWKTSKGLYPTYVCQVAAYYVLITEHRPRHLWPQQAVILRVGKDGQFRVVTLTKQQLSQGWDVFQHALAIYRARWDLEAMVKPPKEPRASIVLPSVNGVPA